MDSNSGGQGEGTKLKNSEKQIYVMLLLVTFAYLIFVMHLSHVLYVSIWKN